MTQLIGRKCKPCEGGVAPLNADEAAGLMQQLSDTWSLGTAAEFIERRFEFSVYSRTIAFVNAVAWLATNEGHHPELTVAYGSCKVRYFTMAINGLSENDFICAAKIDRMIEDYKHA